MDRKPAARRTIAIGKGSMEMSKNIQIKKQPSIHRRRRKVSPILLLLLAALLVLIVVSVVLFLKNFGPQDQDAQGGASVSSSQQSAEGSSSQNSVNESSSVPQQEPSSSSSTGGTANAPLDKPVPESPPVTDSYFDDAVFIGDSISEGIELYGLMDNATIVAHTGLNPQTVLSPIKKKDGTVVDVFAEVRAAMPEKIYVMMGINGIAWINEKSFINFYGQFLDRLISENPGSTIYVQSILPVTSSKEKSDDRYANSKINSYNEKLLQLAAEKKVRFVNVAEAFKDGNGCLPEDVSPDGIHIVKNYYLKWFEYLRAHTVQ